MKYDDHDHEIMAKTLWGEARGESTEGQIAAAFVMRNRAERVEFAGRLVGSDGAVAKICLAPWQFSCWNTDDPNRGQMLKLAPAEYSKQYDIAGDVLESVIQDPTNGADYYHNRFMQPYPAWAAVYKQTAVIGNHIFYDGRAVAAGTFLQTGSSGKGVESLQRVLQALGYYSGKLDGLFGPVTFHAVMLYQKEHGLTADGIVGPKTGKALQL
jgi:hypothetical protein